MRATPFATSLWAIVALALPLSCPLVGQESKVYEAPGTIFVWGNKMELGEIVGIQFTDEGRYVLFATPKGKRYANLWRDEVIQVARLALEAPDTTPSAVSFDFARKASAPFQAEDILDPAGFGVILKSTHPLAELIRQIPGASVLAESLAGVTERKVDKRVLRRVATVLNLARDGRLPVDPNADFLSPATRRYLQAGPTDLHRLNRMVLEDFFSPSLDRDVDSHYAMEYTSKDAENLLRGRRTETIVMDADTDLKHISAGRAGGEYAIGPPEIVLCGEQARADLQQGKEPHRGEYFTYLDLSAPRFRPMADGGLGGWIEHVMLSAHASRVTGEIPECGTRFASNLTRKLPTILEQEGEIPQHLRDLEAMLVLRRAIGFLKQNSVPLSPERLRELALDSEELPNKPPKVVQVPMAIAGGGRAILFSISGGVELGSDPPPEQTVRQKMSAPQGAARDNPGFVGAAVEIGGRSLWAIDISSILAP